MALQTDRLKSYRRQDPPQVPGGDADYLSRQLDQISTSIALLITVAKQLEARIVALGG